MKEFIPKDFTATTEGELVPEANPINHAPKVIEQGFKNGVHFTRTSEGTFKDVFGKGFDK